MYNRNISSSSKIQRVPENPLQSETVENLRQAQKTVESCGLLAKYSVYSEDADSEKQLPALPSESRKTKSLLKEDEGSRAASMKCRSITGPVFASLAQGHETTNRVPGKESTATIKKIPSRVETRTVKSSSSVESFRSTVSEQSLVQNLDFSHEIKEVESLRHAFRTALDILENLIERRMQDRKTEVYLAAKDLGTYLASGENEVGRVHKQNCLEFGMLYVRSWSEYREYLVHCNLTSCLFAQNRGNFNPSRCCS